MDNDITDDQQDLSADDILEEERIARDPSMDVLRHPPRLPQDFDPPATPQNDPLTRDLPDDHPALDDGIDATDKYESDETDASDVWDETESNERKEDALNNDLE